MAGRPATGAVTLEPVYCLGLCARAPAAMLDGKPVGRFDAKRLAALRPPAIATKRRALSVARAAGVIGPSIMSSGHAFDIEVRVGAGAYVCGEATSLLNSLEGKRGVVRAKPPLPAHLGFLGRPTVVNNVLSLATVLHGCLSGEAVGSAA